MSYSEGKCGVLWQNYILNTYVQDRWALILDADELFTYPGCEQIGIQALTKYLEKTGADAFMAPMLDMYSNLPIAETAYISGTPFMRGASLAEATGVLLHFKFMQDFGARVEIEAERKEHFASARQYAAYSKVTSANADLTAYHKGSVRFEDSLQLVELGLMQKPLNYP